MCRDEDRGTPPETVLKVEVVAKLCSNLGFEGAPDVVHLALNPEYERRKMD